MKDAEIYNIFDTEKILGKPAAVAISNTSGLAGIAYWINHHYKLPKFREVTKQDDIVIKIKAAIDKEYEDGRTTVMGDEEIEAIVDSFTTDFKRSEE